MPKAKHPAETADAEKIAGAKKFIVSLFLGTGKFHKTERADLGSARAAATEIEKLHRERSYGRKALIYAIDARDRSTLVPADFDPATLPERIPMPTKTKPAARAKATKAKRAKAKPKAPKPANGARAAIMAAAEAGRLPPPPDFSAATHARFRGKLAAVVDLAKAGDLRGLRAFEINPVSSSPKAIDRYRNLCVIALQAKAAA